MSNAGERDRSQRRHRPHRGPARRRGASTIELAVVLMVFLTLVLGMIDLGIAVFRYHALAHAARQGARQAIVHGAMADRLGPWGPEGYTGMANVDGHPIVEAIRPSLVGFDLSEVTVQAEWVDGENKLEKRVRVTVSAPYQPMMTFIFGNPTYTLRASSTMPIAH